MILCSQHFTCTLLADSLTLDVSAREKKYVCDHPLPSNVCAVKCYCYDVHRVNSMCSIQVESRRLISFAIKHIFFHLCASRLLMYRSTYFAVTRSRRRHRPHLFWRRRTASDDECVCARAYANTNIHGTNNAVYIRNNLQSSTLFWSNKSIRMSQAKNDRKGGAILLTIRCVWGTIEWFLCVGNMSKAGEDRLEFLRVEKHVVCVELTHVKMTTFHSTIGLCVRMPTKWKFASDRKKGHKKATSRSKRWELSNQKRAFKWQCYRRCHHNDKSNQVPEIRL